jgi:hypothetical protein
MHNVAAAAAAAAAAVSQHTHHLLLLVPHQVDFEALAANDSQRIQVASVEATIV